MERENLSNMLFRMWQLICLYRVLNNAMQIGVLIYFEREGNLQDVVCKKPHSPFTVFKSNCFNQRLFITRLIELLNQIFFIYI